jgi:hypothetical protein
MQKIFNPCKAATYLKKPLVVGVPFSHGARTFVPIYGETMFFSPSNEPRTPSDELALLQLNIENPPKDDWKPATGNPFCFPLYLFTIYFLIFTLFHPCNP